jgi:hypothetical protein
MEFHHPYEKQRDSQTRDQARFEDGMTRREGAQEGWGGVSCFGFCFGAHVANIRSYGTD